MYVLPALPLFAHAEERMFRAGAEHWTTRRRVFKTLQFGLIHALIGIPISAAAYFFLQLVTHLQTWLYKDLPSGLGFDAAPVCARFANVRPARTWPGPPWVGPQIDSWTSSLDEVGFTAGVRAIREAIAAGDVYQVNLVQHLWAEFDGDPLAVADALAPLHPLEPAALQGDGWTIVSASPEEFAAWRSCRHDLVTSTAGEAVAWAVANKLKKRLEALGAKRVQQVQSWWVMEAPTGQRFCVVKADEGALAQHARQWK